ncbi:MAG TPA: cytidine/deoxycytidylate deaminase family protein [Candidatus Magasanikbacteria bacterium]|nr:cytidine/deoxycytidylate deaminase family protein [Candidatus Magasanikbacteria bacterium]
MTEEKTTHIRPSWDEYFTDIANTVSKRATCDRGYGGCVIARDKQMLVTGYVGSPKGAPHCDDVGHQIKTTVHEDGHQSQHCVRTVHMEQNAICQAAKLGISINGGTIYVKYTPCFTCAKMLVNAGIVRVVCQKKYHAATDSEEVFKCAGVELVYLSENLEQYDKQ